MVRAEETKQNPPPNPQNPSPRDSKNLENSMFSPGFRSVAEMAGWDEEALLIASLIVEDTPDRDLKQKKRSDLQFKTPPTNSRRKRRAQRKSPFVLSMPVLDLEEDETSKEEVEEKTIESKEEKNPAGKEAIVSQRNELKRRTQRKSPVVVSMPVLDLEEDETLKEVVEKKKIESIQVKNLAGKEAIATQKNEVACSSSGPQCMDKLREELSCAICLEICYEPSTTSCGHSFCRKCLRSAADKCGKRCPKCRQLISSGRSCTVNTVLWNTIQLLFPQEIEARKASASESKPRKPDNQNLPRASHYNARNGSVLSLNSPESVSRERFRRASFIIDGRNRSIRPSRDLDVGRRRRVPSQDGDAALALRLQREEFMDAFRGTDEQSRNSLAFASENLRAMASRARERRN